MKLTPRIFLLLVAFFLTGGICRAQMDFGLKYDSTYITVYKDEFTSRLFVSRKQNGINLNEKLLSPWLKYRTNDRLLLGMGATYSFMTLNLSVKFPFINVDEDLYGESRYIDLQMHTMFRSVIADLYLQWNKGYYISNPAVVFPSYSPQLVRPYRADLRSSIVGTNIQYLFNSRRYSYKASFLQNEFQRKSAGSPIIGAEAYWVLAMSDTAMVGGDIPPVGFMQDQPFNQADFANLGVNAGYAYTFVWKETFYLSLSTSFGLAFGGNLVHNTTDLTTLHSRLSLGLSNHTRISFGFNTKNYYVGLSTIGFMMTNKADLHNAWLGYSSWNIRLNFVKRFILKHPIKALRPDLWNFER